MGVEQQEGLVVGGADADVVEQNPDPNPAVGRVQQFLQQDPAGLVGVPDVVLHVERALGRAGQRDPGRQRLHAVAERIGAALAGARVEVLPDQARDARVVAVQLPAILSHVVLRQADAGGQQQGAGKSGQCRSQHRLWPSVIVLVSAARVREVGSLRHEHVVYRETGGESEAACERVQPDAAADPCSQSAGLH